MHIPNALARCILAFARDLHRASLPSRSGGHRGEWFAGWPTKEAPIVSAKHTCVPHSLPTTNRLTLFVSRLDLPLFVGMGWCSPLKLLWLGLRLGRKRFETPVIVRQLASLATQTHYCNCCRQLQGSDYRSNQSFVHVSLPWFSSGGINMWRLWSGLSSST
ncbi:hypothetical protein D3C80_1371890 [compost metagenome]